MGSVGVRAQVTGALTIRDAGEGDLALLAGFVLQLWEAHGSIAGPNTPDDRARTLLDTTAVKFIERDGVPIAYAALLDMGDYMFIRHFAVDRAHRGGGTGRAAFDALEAACFAGRGVRLDASVKIPGPKAFWEAMGFHVHAHAMQRDARPVEGAAT
ncbi:MAG: GNAT family N-acetyltransferase [Pseudomonadota bacterium]